MSRRLKNKREYVIIYKEGDKVINDFLEEVKKKGKIKDLEDAFKEYPVEEEYHQGKIENILQVAEERDEYYFI